MASSYEEPAFRACGLCASIVHEAVEVRAEMRKFLIQFLNLQNQKKEIENDWEILPVKICITCYQEACAAKRFKDSCLKSIAKLNNKEEGKIIPRSWIIGWSTEEIDAAASRAANDVVLKSNKTRIEDAIKVLQSKISCEDTPKITRSKTKNEDNVKTDKPKEIKDDKKLSENEKKHDIPTKKNENNVKTDKPKEIKDDKKVSENEKKHDIPTINDHLKVQPVVEISWNERQMGEINLKRCEVTLNSIGAAGFQGKQGLLAKEPSTNTKAIGLLPPRVPKTDLKANGEHIDIPSRLSNSKVPVEHISPSTNASNPKTSNKKSHQKKGYVIETIDASGNVVMKNGIDVTKELKSETVTPTSLSKYGRQIFSVNDLSTKGKSPAILPSSKVEHQSSFGRNIRKTSEQTDFSYDTKDISQTKRTKATKSEPQTPSNKQKLLSTSEKKRSRKQLDIGLSPSLEDKLIKKSLIEQEITSSPASKRAKVETSSEMTKSPHLTSQKKSKRKDPATPIQDKMPSEVSDQLAFSNTESIMASMNMAGDEDLVEAFPSQGPYQCELCQNITDTKEEFVCHIRTKHLEDVDDGVLNTLYNDLKKSRRKMELAAKENGQTFKQNIAAFSQDLPLTNGNIYEPTP